MKRKPFDYSQYIADQGIPKIVNKKNLAKQLGCSERQINRMINDGRLPKPMRTQTGRIGGWFASELANHIKKVHQ